MKQNGNTANRSNVYTYI